MKSILNILFIFFVTQSLIAQLPGSGISLESNVLDGVYIQEHIPTKRVVSYIHLREADVMWSKRIWRVLDLKEKKNHKLYYPLEKQNDRISLFEVIRYGALDEGSITLYDLGGIELDDKFRFPVRPNNGNANDPEFKRKLETMFGQETQVDSIEIVNGVEGVAQDVNGENIKITVVEEYTSRDIVRYVLKEDWFFDKQRSMLDVRIIGISPVVYSRNPETTEIDGLKNLFWLYFPECRYVFQNFFVYNPDNDAQRMSFDDLFWKRDFSSYVQKESNVFDRAVSPNWDGLDALLQSEKVRNEIFTFEHDLWHF
ncbi:MAG: gliding motility protein GldN [Flavobacteriales bacterium]|nr:gliding motility protein GldN [Flavobacteriales bacterium]